MSLFDLRLNMADVTVHVDPDLTSWTIVHRLSYGRSEIIKSST